MVPETKTVNGFKTKLNTVNYRYSILHFNLELSKYHSGDDFPLLSLQVLKCTAEQGKEITYFHKARLGNLFTHLCQIHNIFAS